MKLKELARICLTGRESAARVGCNFRLDHIRLTNMGLSQDDINRVERTVYEIESFTERALGELDSPART